MLFRSLFLLLPFTTGNEKAEEARWLMDTASWGTMSFSENSKLDAAVLPYGISEGRIFFYLMGEQPEAQVSLTVSEASLLPDEFGYAGCGWLFDVEDPRCAKLTMFGTLKVAQDVDMGREALFRKHAEMKNWPESHHFTVHEVAPQDIWMIASFGGGDSIDPADFVAADPVHHTMEDEKGVVPTVANDAAMPPPHEETTARARWLVHKALWTIVTTSSERLNQQPWGNVRSTVDGSTLHSSTGLPVFYLPTPDPTNVDVQANPEVVLTFTEASVADLVRNNQTCQGIDTGNPTCAQVMLYGKAVSVKDAHDAMTAFGLRHPLASWLSEGGAHTGGDYYTMELTNIRILDYYGGYTTVDVDEYLSYEFAGGDDQIKDDDPSNISNKSTPNFLWGLVLGAIAGWFVHDCFCKRKNYEEISDLELKTESSFA